MGKSVPLSPHLTTGEIACKCGCGFGLDPADVSPDLPIRFELIRSLAKRPLWIASGARCEEHNEEEGGVENSAHTRISALDIGVSGGRDRIELIVAIVLAAALEADALDQADAEYLYTEILARIRGLGIARGFIHTDIDLVLPRPAAWTY
jgi:hypothetical protein